MEIQGYQYLSAAHIYQISIRKSQGTQQSSLLFHIFHLCKMNPFLHRVRIRRAPLERSLCKPDPDRATAHTVVGSVRQCIHPLRSPSHEPCMRTILVLRPSAVLCPGPHLSDIPKPQSMALVTTQSTFPTRCLHKGQTSGLQSSLPEHLSDPFKV